MTDDAVTATIREIGGAFLDQAPADRVSGEILPPSRSAARPSSVPRREERFPAVHRLEAPSRIDFDHDHEPAWSTPTDVGHYLEEWDSSPRDAGHTPDWLAERLARARA